MNNVEPCIFCTAAPLARWNLELSTTASRRPLVQACPKSCIARFRAGGQAIPAPPSAASQRAYRESRGTNSVLSKSEIHSVAHGAQTEGEEKWPWGAVTDQRWNPVFLSNPVSQSVSLPPFSLYTLCASEAQDS